MKKIIIISAIIVALAAVFAVFAVKTDLVKPAEKAEIPVEQKTKPEELKKNIKLIKPMKIQKLNINGEKLRKNLQKSREEKSDFNQNQKKCGE